jgi:hypothetical protein
MAASLSLRWLYWDECPWDNLEGRKDENARLQAARAMRVTLPELIFLGTRT